MSLITDYCALADLKSYLHIADTGDDVELALAITAASRAIDQAANRHFGQDGTAVARYYTFTPRAGGDRWRDVQARYLYTSDPFRGQDTIVTDDISTVTGLIVKFDQDADGVFETTLTVDTDYLLFPFNAAAEGRPWERLVFNVSQAAPVIVRGIQVTAKFGWTAIPDTIKNACLIQASRFFKRRESPFGVAGSPDLGNELRLLAKLDPDVAVLINHYRKIWAFA